MFWRITMRNALHVMFLLCSAASAQAQYVFNGSFLSGKVFPYNVSTIIAFAGNDSEKYLIGVDFIDGKVKYFRAAGKSEFQEFFPQLKGYLYNKQSGAIVNEKISYDRDGMYFSTFGDEPIGGGSYRIQSGIVEEIALDKQNIDIRMNNGGIQKLTFSGVGVASPIPGGGYVFRASTEASKTKNVMVKEKNGSYRILFQLPNADGVPYGVWSLDGLTFQFVEVEGRVSYFSEYNTVTQKITRFFSTSETIDGENILIFRVSKSETGERYVTFSLESGKVKVVRFPRKVKLDELYTVPAQIAGFKTSWAGFPTVSEQAALVPLYPNLPANIGNAGLFVPQRPASLFVQSGVTVLPDGKKVTGISSGLIFATKCTINIPLQLDGFGNNHLYELTTPCVPKPLSGLENSSITVEGSGFTLGKPVSVELRIGTIGFAPATVLSDTKLSFPAPSLTRCPSPCAVSVVLRYQDGTSIESNTQTLFISPVPVSKPVVAALTDLYGKVGAGPGKAMTLWGSSFCSVVLALPIVQERDLVIPLPTSWSLGCRVLVDSKPVGLYFAFTRSDPEKSSQINLLLPYDLPKGDHTVVVEKLDTRDGVTIVTSTSDPFRFVSEDSSPTFFKPFEYSLTTQNASKGYSLISSTNPAEIGDYLVIYLSGGGQMRDLIPDRGVLVTSYRSPLKVTIGGVETSVLYAGTQGVFPGIEQVNLVIPVGVDTSAGYTELTVSMDGKSQSFSFHVK